ncbi:type IX secretion system protein PorG [Soonwooa purpurea]
MRIKTVYTFFILLVSFFSVTKISAQRHEVGIQAGLSNLVGDIGNTNFILQKPILGKTLSLGVPVYFGAIYRLNVNPQQSLRLGLGYSHIQFSDLHAKENYRRQRGLYGSNSVFHADLTFEYYFFDINEEHKSKVSPYVFAGIGGMMYNAVKLKNVEVVNGQVEPTYDSTKKMSMDLPFGVGVKYKFNYNWALSAEATFRQSFSDMIDYSQIESNVEGIPNDFRQIGNPNSNDWINSATIILSYSFGRPPCYCK